MKKLLSLFVLLAALCFTLSPQKARAQVDEYLCVKGSATINIKVTGTPEEFPDLWYSTDKTNWTQITGVTNWNTGNVTTYFKGHNPNGFNHSSTNFVSIAIMGGNPALGGNIMSLIDDVNFATNNSTIPCDYCFYALFCPYPPAAFSTSYSSTLTAASYLYYAKDMVLPATNLTSYCYAYLLAGNSGLKNGPQLPAMVMQPWCYAHMFDGCQDNFYGSYASNDGYYLSDMKLPAQQLAEGCYAFMFNRCAVLYNNDANNYYVLPAEELAPKCYMGMFGLYNAKCTTLKYVEIMATSLQDRYGNDITNCLAYMFNNATAAKSATGTWLYGRGNLTLKMHWLDWGAYNGTAQTGDGPTQSWFLGYSQSSTTFLYQNGLTPTTIGAYEKDYATKMYCNPFPYSSTLTAQNYTYLTFNCAANGGTWEEGSAYNTDLRRVVRANYTAKTIPAPPVKANSRFIGWFTTASGEGSMLTEDELKQKTTATTVFARFVDNDKYTFYVNPSDKATITVTDNSSNSYTPGTLYILNSNDQTFTFSYSDVASGYSFYKWTGGTFTDEAVTFGTKKDLVISGIFTGTPASAAKAETVYQIGTGAGKSQIFDLPAEAVDLGAAGIWAKYNVDKTTANGFAASFTATGSYFAWGKLTQGASTTGNFYDASSMASGESLPVTDETDAAYRYCGHNWRIPTKDEWQTLLDNTTVATASYNQTFTSKSNSNTMTLPKNGWTNSVSGSASQTNTINYWTSTFYNWNTSYNYQSTAYGYRGGMSGNTVYSPVLNYVDAGNNNNYIYTGCGIRPIFNMPCKKLTINSNGYIYIYECEPYQTVTVTAEADEDEGYRFARWKDEAGNVISTTNPLVVNVYDNLTYTAEFEEVVGEKRTVTFYDDDMTTVLYSEQRTEGLMPVYRGSTPTKEGYTFTGWTPAFAVIGATDVNYYATYLPNYTITTVNGGKATITLTADGYAGQTVSGTYMETTEVVLTVDNVAGGYSFVRWSDGNTDNPRTVTVTGNATYTAEFGIESRPVSVNIYQTTTADVKKIVYNLSPKKGKDGIEYRPVDMGMGIAWANKNVGASDSTVAGTYFYWGDIEGHTSFGSLYIDTRPAELPTGLDAAYNKIGESWRMPSKDDWLTLKNNATLQNGGTFVSNVDNSKKIFLPISGAYAYNYTKSSQRCYMSRTYRSNDIEYVFRDVNGSYDVQSNLGSNNDLDIACGLPVRAIYNPQYTVRTLTIHVVDHDYIYYCQDGQQVTVTAVPDASEAQMFKWWSDNHSNTTAKRTFTMTSDISVEAVFQEDPSIPLHHVIFYDEDGSTILDQQDVKEGKMPVYGGQAPTKTGYYFKCWNPYIQRMGTSNVTYTAVYHSLESADAFVDVYQNVSANSTKIVYYLPKNIDGNDNNKYSAVDMGYGVAWADRNVGAENPNDIGGYFKWGNPNDVTNSIPSSTNGHDVSSLNTTYTLIDDEDAAKVQMGNTWKMPISTEWDTFLNNTTLNGDGTFFNKSDNTQYIFLPASVNGTSLSSSWEWGNKRVYWCRDSYYNSKERVGWNTTTMRSINVMTNQSGNYSVVHKSGNYSITSNQGMNVRAIYVPSYTPCTLTVNISGSTYSYKYLCQPGQSVTVTANATSGHVFDKWTEDNDTHATRTFAVTGNMTYTATFKEAPSVTTYNVTGTPNNNNYGSVSGNGSVNHGGNITLTASPEEHYHFVNWTENETVLGTNATLTLENVTADHTSIIANFAINTYTVTWKDEDGETILETDASVAYGDTPSFDGETPTKDADEEAAGYTYTFNAWSPAIAIVTGNATYTATFTPAKKQYTLTWDVNGGNALTGTYTNGTIDWGTAITKPADPTKAGYTFGGWDADNDGKADKVAKTMPTNDITYKALWTAASPNITLCEYCDNSHYNTFKSDYDRKTVNVTYPRQFAANRWSTMCLPFSIELPEMITQKMYGRVYEFKYATGNANTNSGVNLYFSNAKKIEAGKCYIVNANDALAAKTSFVFSGVTIDLTKDNGADLSSPETPEASMAAYNALPGYKSEGTIELVGTLRNGTLHGTATGNTYMGLKDNKIYYPNISQGSTIWAYRGIFRSTETLNIEKMRIIVDGEDRGEIIIDADGEILDASGNAESRKFIENGILYIEREGVIYDAQGKRVESSF